MREILTAGFLASLLAAPLAAADDFCDIMGKFDANCAKKEGAAAAQNEGAREREEPEKGEAGKKEEKGDPAQVQARKEEPGDDGEDERKPKEKVDPIAARAKHEELQKKFEQIQAEIAAAPAKITAAEAVVEEKQKAADALLAEARAMGKKHNDMARNLAKMSHLLKTDRAEYMRLSAERAAAYEKTREAGQAYIAAVAEVPKAKQVVADLEARLKQLRLKDYFPALKAATEAGRVAGKATREEEKAALQALPPAEKLVQKGISLTRFHKAGDPVYFTAHSDAKEACEHQLGRKGFLGRCVIGGACGIRPDTAGLYGPPSATLPSMYPVGWGACIEVHVPGKAGYQEKVFSLLIDPSSWGSDEAAKYQCELQTMTKFKLASYECQKDGLSCRSRAKASAEGMLEHRTWSHAGQWEQAKRSWSACLEGAYVQSFPPERAALNKWDVPSQPGWRIEAQGSFPVDTGVAAYLLTPPDGRPAVVMNQNAANQILKGYTNVDAASERMTELLESTYKRGVAGLSAPPSRAPSTRSNNLTQNSAHVLIVTDIFRTVLGREPDYRELTLHTRDLKNGAVTEEGLRAKIEACQALPADDPENCDKGIYEKGRIAYAERSNNPLPDDLGIETRMATAEEIDIIYREVLGREADPTGRGYWVQQVETGAQTIGQVRALITACHALPENDSGYCK